MSQRKRGKANISMVNPEPPAFIKRIREQIVASEDTDRKERADQRRRDRPARPNDDDDDPTVVKIGDNDLTEEEYKKMKKDLETQYKVEILNETKIKPMTLDIDKLFSNCRSDRDKTLIQSTSSKRPRSPQSSRPSTHPQDKLSKPKLKKLAFESFSDEED